MVLDMQARLLLDMLGKGIESALINPSALVPDPWQVSSETLSSIDPEAVAVEPALVPCVQVCLVNCCNHVLRILFDEKIKTWQLLTAALFSLPHTLFFVGLAMHLFIFTSVKEFNFFT